MWQQYERTRRESPGGGLGGPPDGVQSSMPRIGTSAGSARGGVVARQVVRFVLELGRR